MAAIGKSVKESVHFDIQKLSGPNNYVFWQHKVRMLLVKEKVWSVIVDPEKKRGDIGYEEWSERNDAALAMINLLVEDRQLVHIVEATTAKQAWNTLKEYNRDSSLSNKVHLLRKLYNLRLAETGSVEEYITEFLTIVRKLSAIGNKFEDFVLACTLLCSLPESYSMLVASFDALPEKEISLELVIVKLIREYSNRRREQELVGDSGREKKALPMLNDGKSQQTVSYIGDLDPPY